MINNVTDNEFGIFFLLLLKFGFICFMNKYATNKVVKLSFFEDGLYIFIYIYSFLMCFRNKHEVTYLNTSHAKTSLKWRL